MKKSNSGMILITILLFMQVFINLGLFALQNAFLSTILSHAFYQYNNHRQHVERALIHIEKSWVKSCLIPLMNRQELIIKPLEWWKSRLLCMEHKNSYQYYYAIENLGEDPCAFYTLQPSKSAHYFRVTVLALSNDSQIKEMLQSTIIKMDNAILKCEGQPHLIIPGRQAWRIL